MFSIFFKENTPPYPDEQISKSVILFFRVRMRTRTSTKCGHGTNASLKIGSKQQLRFGIFSAALSAEEFQKIMKPFDFSGYSGIITNLKLKVNCDFGNCKLYHA